jgi:hypothetical protein
MIHLYSHGYEGEDLLDFTLKLSNPSSIAQQQKLELIKSKFEIAGTAPEGIVSRRWIRKNILDMTDQEIENVIEEKSDDKLEDAAVEAAGKEDEGGGGESGGDTGGGDEGGGDEGGGGLFSGDEPKGTLLTARPGTGKSEKDLMGDEEDEEDVDSPQSKLSIDDPDAPLKALNRIEKSTKRLNMFGEPIKASRRVTDGPASTHMPNFAKMTGTGTTQGTLRNPYDKNWLFGVGESTVPRNPAMADFIDKQMARRGRMSQDIKSALDKYASTVRNDKPSILKEASVSAESGDAQLEIDLDSLGSKASDE